MTQQIANEQARPQQLLAAANGVVDRALLQSYLELQIEALRAEKEARDKRAQQRATLKRIVNQFGPPTLWIVALVALGIGTAKMDSSARLSAVIMQPPSLLQHLGAVWKTLPGPPSSGPRSTSFTLGAAAALSSSAAQVNTNQPAVDVPGAALKILTDYRDVAIAIATFLLPWLLTVGAIVLQKVVTKRAGTVIGSLLTLGIAALFLATAVAASDWQFATALVLAVIAFSIFAIINRLMDLALEFSSGADSTKELLQLIRSPLSVWVGKVMGWLTHPARYLWTRVTFIGLPLVANLDLIAGLLGWAANKPGKWSYVWGPVIEIGVAGLVVWTIWLAIAAASTRDFFHPTRNRRTFRVFIALPVGAYVAIILAVTVAYQAETNSVPELLAAWAFLVAAAAFVLWSLWGAVVALNSKSAFHPTHRRAALLTFIVLPVPSLVAFFVLALAITTTPQDSWLYALLVFSMTLGLLLLCVWILWAIVVLLAKLTYRQPLRQPASAIVFIALPALTFLTMMATWESANSDGSSLFELAALLFAAWCLWLCGAIFANRGSILGDNRPVVKRAFIAAPVVSLVIVLAARVAALILLGADRQAWASVSAFIWTFLFLVGVLTYLLWALWAWQVVPRRLRPVFVPTLVFVMAGIFFGPLLFAFMLALLLVLTLPGSLNRAARRPEAADIVATTSG